MNKDLVIKLLKVAYILDNSGFIKEANNFDNIVQKIVVSQSSNTKQLEDKLFNLMHKSGMVDKFGSFDTPSYTLENLNEYWFGKVQPAFNIKDPIIAQWLSNKYLVYKKSILKYTKERQDVDNRNIVQRFLGTKKYNF
jgi:hypothetical protein